MMESYLEGRRWVQSGISLLGLAAARCLAFGAQLLPLKGFDVGTAALNLSFQKRRTTGGRKHPVTRKGLSTAKVGENPDL